MEWLVNDSRLDECGLACHARTVKHYEFDYPLNIRVVFERIMSVAHNVQGLYFEYASDVNYCIGLKVLLLKSSDDDDNNSGIAGR